MAIAGDASPGQELKEGTLGSGDEKHEGAHGPGSLGKRGVECGSEEGVLFLDTLPTASLGAESREETGKIRKTHHSCSVLQKVAMPILLIGPNSLFGLWVDNVKIHVYIHCSNI